MVGVTFTALFCLVAFQLLSFVAGVSTSSGPSGSTFSNKYHVKGYQLGSFVDLNADRNTDIILVDQKGSTLSAVIAPPKKVSFISSGKSSDLPEPVQLLSTGLSDPVRSIATADFNGDSIVDILLLTSSSEDQGPFAAYISYGKATSGVPTYGESFAP